MRIKSGNGKNIILEIDEVEAEAIFYVLGFCIGGISKDREIQAIKMLGQYESFVEYNKKGGG